MSSNCVQNRGPPLTTMNTVQHDPLFSVKQISAREFVRYWLHVSLIGRKVRVYTGRGHCVIEIEVLIHPITYYCKTLKFPCLYHL